MSVNTSLLQLNGSTGSFVQLQSPATGAGNTLILPTGNGAAGQVLSTDGTGILSWQDGGGGYTAALNTITASAFDLSLGPFWQVLTSFILPTPTNLVIAQSGIIKFDATPTGFSSAYELGGCGNIVDGTIVAFFVASTTKILLSNPTGLYT